MTQEFIIRPRGAASIRLEKFDDGWQATVYEYRFGSLHTDWGRDPDPGKAIDLALDCVQIGAAYKRAHPDFSQKNTRNAMVRFMYVLRRLNDTLDKVV